MIYKISIGQYSLICYTTPARATTACILHSSALKHNRHQHKQLQAKYNDFGAVEFIVLDESGIRKDINKWIQLEDPEFVLNSKNLKEKKPKKAPKPVMVLDKPDTLHIELMSEGELDNVSNWFIQKGWGNLNSQEKNEWARISDRLASYRLFPQEHYTGLMLSSIMASFEKKGV